ncbi:hypothetical protein ACTXMZ_17065 [Brachybacterium alimentarium]|uniref:hypothetical protein n=1 Tax=Brachybacterium alimentarium TaxID=47845 RepID=UPI003FD178E5
MNTHRKDMPTQVAHPWKATVRTIVAYVVAGAALFVVAVPIVNDQLGAYLPDSWEAWLLGAVSVITAIAGALTRIMALDQAQRFLALIGLGTGVEKEIRTIGESGRFEDVEGAPLDELKETLAKPRMPLSDSSVTADEITHGTLTADDVTTNDAELDAKADPND